MCQQAACKGAASHGGHHEAGKDHAMGQMLAIWAESRSPQEDKSVHAALKQRLHGAKQANPWICRTNDNSVSRRPGQSGCKNLQLHCALTAARRYRRAKRCSQFSCGLHTMISHSLNAVKHMQQLVYDAAHSFSRQAHYLKRREQKIYRQ